MILKPYKPIRRRNGYALYFSIILLALCVLVAAGLNRIVDRNKAAVEKANKSEKAYYLARAGLQKAISELESDHWWAVSAPETFSVGKEGGSYTVSVWAPISNLHTSRKLWKVVSYGQLGTSRRTLVAWLVRKPFTDFVCFSDVESAGDTILWVADRDKIEGDIHTNSFFSVMGRPQFAGSITSSNFNDPYLSEDKRKYIRDGKIIKDPSKFYHYYSGYKTDEPVEIHGIERQVLLTGASGEVQMPEEIDYIKNAAGKIYTDDIYVRFFDTGKVRIRSKSEDKWNTEDLDSSNLTVFTDGKATIEGGVIKGICTIAAAKDMEILDGITYQNPKKDILGLVCNEDIRLITDTQTRQDISIDAAILSLNGSFYLKDYMEGIPRGSLNIFGCLAQKTRGPVGSIKKGEPFSGYTRNYRYDPRLLHKAPPNFPTSGLIEVISVQ
jgi:hypothetical protein